MEEKSSSSSSSKSCAEQDLKVLRALEKLQASIFLVAKGFFCKVSAAAKIYGQADWRKKAKEKKREELMAAALKSFEAGTQPPQSYHIFIVRRKNRDRSVGDRRRPCHTQSAGCFCKLPRMFLRWNRHMFLQGLRLQRGWPQTRQDGDPLHLQGRRTRAGLPRHHPHQWSGGSGRRAGRSREKGLWLLLQLAALNLVGWCVFACQPAQVMAISFLGKAGICKDSCTHGVNFKACMIARMIACMIARTVALVIALIIACMKPSREPLEYFDLNPKP